MELFAGNIRLINHAATITHNSNAAAALVKTIGHEELLSKIASGFGFSESEANDMMREIVSYAHSHYTNMQHGLSLRMWLSKMMVHKCVFKISSRLFSEMNPGVKNTSFIGYTNKQEQEMPFSFKAVYILKTVVGFTETEIAEVLNTTVANAKERLTKARMFIIKH